MTESNYISNYNTVFKSGCQVICGPHAVSGHLLKICAEISVRNPVRILDFGNRCDMYFTARQLRCLTRDPAAAMQNIRLQRAFTCYQALSLLQQLDRSETDIPVIILDMLSPFLDENIQTNEINRLFREVLRQIRSSAQNRMLLIGVKPAPRRLAPDRVGLLHMLAEEFGMTVLTETEPEDRTDSGPVQLSLFEQTEGNE